MTRENFVSRECHQKSPTNGHVSKLFLGSEFQYKGNKQTYSVLPRLRFCAIVPQNFEYDAAKTVPVGHLAHIDFGLSQDFESVGCVENSLAKNNIVFHRNSHSYNSFFDWCIGFLNCTGTSVQ